MEWFCSVPLLRLAAREDSMVKEAGMGQGEVKRQETRRRQSHSTKSGAWTVTVTCLSSRSDASPE